jgi:hypothetical protein
MTALDFAATFGLGVGILVAVAIFVFAILRQQVSAIHLLGAIAVLIAYGVSIIWLPDLITWPAWVNALHWNWTGKLISIATTLSLILLWPGLSTAEAGLTLRHKDGSIGPAILAAAILCASAMILQSLVGAGSDTRLETLLFEATLPGIDEELAFRGLLAALLARAFIRQVSVFGAPMGWGDLALCLVFAAGHGLMFIQQQIHFDPFSFGYTGFVGAGLLWMRQRTGSLMLPVLTHNVVNILLVTL